MTYRNEERETGIRIVFVEGIPVSVSNQRGGVVIIGKREYLGKTVTLISMEANTKDVHATFSTYRTKGHVKTAAVFSRVKPGNYYTVGWRAGIDSVGIVDISVNTQWAKPVYWR